MVDNGDDPIVVGVDGSAARMAALAWAVAEAVWRRCALEAVVVAETEKPEIRAQVEAVGAAACPVVVVRDSERATKVPAEPDVDVLATPGPLL